MAPRAIGDAPHFGVQRLYLRLLKRPNRAPLAKYGAVLEHILGKMWSVSERSNSALSWDRRIPARWS